MAVANLSDGSTAEGRDRLEDAVRRAAVTCYASEGIYPPTLAYLEEHYGVQVDESRYTVFYEAFAENLMPDITVVENEGACGRNQTNQKAASGVEEVPKTAAGGKDGQTQQSQRHINQLTEGAVSGPQQDPG